MAVINGVEVAIDVGAVTNGMTLIVRPGERIPADGLISEGEPNIDESMLTGESIPVEKVIGDTVIGGSLNGNIPFRMTVTAAGERSTLAAIVRTVSEAQARKAPVQALVDRVAGVFTPVVLGIALLTLAAWLILAPDNPLMIKAVVSVLIIACPCALGLATPTAVLAGTGRAARAGIIIRGGDILEQLHKIDTIVFDKTGTLTHGNLAVSEIKSFGNYSESKLLMLAGSVEINSEHPVAAAIVRHMKHQAIKSVSIRNIKTQPGFGLTAQYEGRRIVVGSRLLMNREGIPLGEAEEFSDAQMRLGKTVVFVAEDDEVVGLLSLSDRLRGEARELISHLKKWAPQVMMLSGDNRQTAEGVARALDLDSFEAEVRPEQKQEMIRSLRKAGFKVAMVGDGINDAPALAAADIGIAVGTGTDVALETADVVLVNPDLANVRRLFTLGRQSFRTIKTNLFWALFYNLVAIPVAAGVLYPIMGITLSPVMAAAAMAFSSVFVVSNSLRLTQLDLR
jgi:Cu+-exporting ATPase